MRGQELNEQATSDKLDISSEDMLFLKAVAVAAKRKVLAGAELTAQMIAEIMQEQLARQHELFCCNEARAFVATAVTLHFYPDADADAVADVLNDMFNEPQHTYTGCW